VRVGRLAHGGWEGELDVVAYHPQENRLLHLEPSLDAHAWARREERFRKKFESARRYIFTEVFPWLSEGEVELEQVAILVSRGQRTELAGAGVRTIDEVVGEIVVAVRARGKASKAAIPEQYPNLRTIQLVVCGYYRTPTGRA
jgi:hypothetical protein